ncbi:hypothetical protein K1719_003149 [Acacia pycnantha]|nr:hypothetical protein K1719_003149 [Acacia pycnantha]
MLHLVPIESSPENEPPPHPGDGGIPGKSVNHTQMNVDNQQPATAIFPFKDKLLNNDQSFHEEEEEVTLQQGDVSIGMDGTIPVVDFATYILNALNKRRGLAVIIKLLGRKIGIRPLCAHLQNIWKPTGKAQVTD